MFCLGLPLRFEISILDSREPKSRSMLVRIICIVSDRIDLFDRRRLGTESTRKDFLTVLVQKVESGEVDKEEMTAHVSTLV